MTALVSFIGALLGAGVPSCFVWRGQRQSGRVEWRTRLDRAIDLITAPQENVRQIGDELLADLLESDLGSDSDRDLAQRISRLSIDAVDEASRAGDTGRRRRAT